MCRHQSLFGAQSGQNKGQPPTHKPAQPPAPKSDTRGGQPSNLSEEERRREESRILMEGYMDSM